MFNLKKILLINGGSSAVTGLLLSAIPGTLAGIFGLQHRSIFIGVGLFLIFFSFLVFFAGLRLPIKAGLVKLIISLDVIWVVVSIGVVVLQPDLTLIGYLLIIAIAAWVVLMAFLQKKNLKEAEE